MAGVSFGIDWLAESGSYIMSCQRCVPAVWPSQSTLGLLFSADPYPLAHSLTHLGSQGTRAHWSQGGAPGLHAGGTRRPGGHATLMSLLLIVEPAVVSASQLKSNQSNVAAWQDWSRETPDRGANE
jgi:hypothetical protein